MELLANIDVDDLGRGIEFYRRALGLSLVRRLFGGMVAEMAGASAPIFLIEKAAGTTAGASTDAARSYARHWTPVHLDFVVDDIGAAVRRAQAAGAALEGEISTPGFGKLAVLADPFGHGFCLIEFVGRGYGEVAD